MILKKSQKSLVRVHQDLEHYRNQLDLAEPITLHYYQILTRAMAGINMALECIEHMKETQKDVEV